MKKITLLFLFITVLITNAYSQLVTLKSYEVSDTLSWVLPFASENGTDYDFRHFPDATKNFTTGFGQFFFPESPGRLTDIRFFIEAVYPEKADSAVNRFTGDYERVWKFAGRTETETFERFAQLVKAPYVGELESVSLNLKKISQADGNDSIIVRFHPKLTSVTQTESYFNPQITWFFGLPRTTNNVTQYGVRFTAPGTEGSVKLQAVDFYIFSINDTRFFSGYDTPANDTLIVRVYDLNEQGFPTSVLAEVKAGFADLSSGFDNRFDFSMFNLQFDAGKDYVIAAEVQRVGAQDFIGLVSGNSFDTPLNRSIMFENDGWIYLSSSASWGSSGAKGAEIRATAIYEDPNNNTPNSAENSSPYLAVSFRDIPDNGRTNLQLKEPLSLFEGEELWISVEQKLRVFRDSMAVVSDTVGSTNGENSAAFFAQKNGVRSWYFTANSPSIHKNINFDISANFTAQLNDRLLMDVYQVQNTQPADLLYSGSVSYAQLNSNNWNSVSIANELVEVASGDTLFVSFEPFVLQQSDGIVFRTDAGNEARNAESFAHTWIKKSQAIENAFEGHWIPLESPNFPRLWAELNMNVLSTSVETENELPDQTELLGAFPNPFNPTTAIKWRLAQSQSVKLMVYDALGREVFSQNLGLKSAGEHQFRFDGQSLSTGMYVYRLMLDNKVLTGKMMLVK